MYPDDNDTRTLVGVLDYYMEVFIQTRLELALHEQEAMSEDTARQLRQSALLRNAMNGTSPCLLADEESPADS